MKNIISSNSTILEALKMLQETAFDIQSLFVASEEDKMIGSLSDGDIRRGLICGAKLEDNVSVVMHKDFKFLYSEELDVVHIKQYRDMQIFVIPILDRDMHIVDAVNLKKYKSYLPIDAVLMAGGKGERLRPLTEKTPKPLLPVGNKAIIDHNIDNLITFGVNHIFITVNYLKEQLEQHYSEPRNGIKIECCREPKFLGTLGAIKVIKSFHNDTVLVMNSDLFTNINFEDFYLHFLEHNADMSVAAIPYSISIPYGICDLDGCCVKGVIEKPTFNYYANAGIYLLKREMIDLIPKNTFFNATDMIELLVKNGKRVIRFPLNGTWIDIGNPQEYQKAKDLVNHLSI